MIYRPDISNLIAPGDGCEVDMHCNSLDGPFTAISGELYLAMSVTLIERSIFLMAQSSQLSLITTDPILSCLN